MRGKFLFKPQIDNLAKSLKRDFIPFPDFLVQISAEDWQA